MPKPPASAATQPLQERVNNRSQRPTSDSFEAFTDGVVFTIEPGLNFRNGDLGVPEEYRGIGVRIEENILMTADGPLNLSAALPRKPDEAETWMDNIRRKFEGRLGQGDI